jgi:hypothetical protein
MHLWPRVHTFADNSQVYKKDWHDKLASFGVEEGKCTLLLLNNLDSNTALRRDHGNSCSNELLKWLTRSTHWSTVLVTDKGSNFNRRIRKRIRYHFFMDDDVYDDYPRSHEYYGMIAQSRLSLCSSFGLAGSIGSARSTEFTGSTVDFLRSLSSQFGMLIVEYPKTSIKYHEYHMYRSIRNFIGDNYMEPRSKSIVISNLINFLPLDVIIIILDCLFLIH